MKCQAKFLSTLSLRRATAHLRSCGHGPRYFYPRSPCGERRWPRVMIPSCLYFYPRSPCGERPKPLALWQINTDFYPRSPCGERPTSATATIPPLWNFYPRSPCGERLRQVVGAGPQAKHFYPRSPCGERLAFKSGADSIIGISIHALLAESDFSAAIVTQHPRDFYPRSPCGERQTALRACSF